MPPAWAQRIPGGIRRPPPEEAEESSDSGEESADGSRDRAPTGGVGRRTGFELELHGTLTTQRGRPFVLRGTAYEVLGLATLRPYARGRVLVYELDERGNREEQPLAEGAAGDGGRFSFNISPRRSQIEVVIRDGRKERSWQFSVTFTAPARYELLTDRSLYEPGETVHGWLRVVDAASAAPVRGRPVEWVFGGESGAARLGQTRNTTSDAGVASASVAIPTSAPDGLVPVVAVVDGERTMTSVRVGRRTVERVFATVRVDQRVVGPGARVTGRVTVSTPSGTPVTNASVSLLMNGQSAASLTTDREGIATFSINAPAYLAEPVSGVALVARAVHPAYGTINATTSFTMARVPFEIESVVANAAVVPEVPGTVFLTLTTPTGDPAPANTGITVTGRAVQNGRVRVTTDRHGIAAIPTRLPRNAAARHDSGQCEGNTATSFDITVESEIPLATRLCVRAETSATVVPHVLSATANAGGRVEIAIERGPLARGRAVSVDLMHTAPRQAGRAVIASTIAAAADGRVTFTLPRDYVGPLYVRARPVTSDGSAEGIGAMDALLVRPARAFSLALSADKDLYHVRETAHLTVRTPAGLEGAHVAFVARDLAAHGGESNWSLAWLAGAVERAVADPSTPESDRLVRSALASMLAVDTAPNRAAPLVAPENAQEETEEGSDREGDLRDPYVLRDELVRRGVGPVMMTVEQAIAQAMNDGERNGIIAAGGRGFDPRILHTLIRRETLDRDTAVTLGGGEMTIAMLQASDPSFTFDRVARRIARKKLVGLLAALANFAENARAARTEPQERWLSRIAGANASVLRDPWGGTYALRRVTPGTESVAIHRRLSGWELVSPGPDRAVGTADDVRNPFERAVPQGTVYAVASGEDTLMAQLAALDPGSEVLTRVLAAYGRIADAANDESTGDVISAGESEQLAAPRARAAPASITAAADGDAFGYGGLGMSGYGMGGGGTGEGTIGLGNIGTIGHGSGTGSGQGYGSGSGRMSSSRVTRGPSSGWGAYGRRVTGTSALIRERFPATLRFVAEHALDRSGTTTIDLPLADALTTYRVEAIAWTSDGWTTSERMELRVDQDAVVDAPVPPFAAVNDVIRLPVRLQNRTRNPIRARVEVTCEGDLALEGTSRGEIEVPANDAREVIVSAHPTRAGQGALVITATDLATNAPLDAARRPLEVMASARPVRSAVEALADGRAELVLDVPGDAVFRAQGVVRVSRGDALFGDVREWINRAGDKSWPAWVLALQGEPVGNDGSAAREVTQIAQYLWDPARSSRAISALWLRSEVSDSVLRAMIENIGRRFEGYERTRRMRRSGDVSSTTTFEGTEPSIRLLVGLAGAWAHRDRRPALRELLTDAVQPARVIVENEAATSEDPALFARAAFALTLTGGTGNSRVREFLRRAARGEDDGFGGTMSLSDTETSAGFFMPDPRDRGERVDALAAYGLSLLAEGDRNAAFRVVRALARRAPNVQYWSEESRALAMLLLAKITTPMPSGSNATIHVTLDGRPFDLPVVQGVAILLARELSMPGQHRVVVDVPRGTVLVAQAEGRYGRPWSVQPTVRGPLFATIEGEPGPRDTRAAYVLRVQNRSVRVLSNALIEVDVPSGAELDQDTRVALERRLAAPALLTGRTLALRLRALPPGGFVRVPLPLRWSVSGSISGLGIAAYAGPELGAGVTVVAPRVIEVADEGEEAARPDDRSIRERRQQGAQRGGHAVNARAEVQ
ncbi:MAG: alpha-2-macroglobulin family protein [Polyangiales bacterium]